MLLYFRYNGEVNVAQDELNSFLSVAEELKVKGLTQSNQSKAPDRKKADQEMQQRGKEAVQVAPVKQEHEQASGQVVHHGDEQVAAEYQEEGEEYGVEFEDYGKYDGAGEFPGNDTAEVKGDCSFAQLSVVFISYNSPCPLNPGVSLYIIIDKISDNGISVCPITRCFWVTLVGSFVKN